MPAFADDTLHAVGAQILALLAAIWGVIAAGWQAVLGVVLAEPGGWLKGGLLVAALAFIEWRVRYSLGGWVNTIKRPSEHGSGAWVWLTAPGVAMHELGHALMTLLFFPLGYRVRRVVLFNPGLSRVKVEGGYSLAAVGYVATSDPQHPLPLIHNVVRVLISLAPLPFGWLALTLIYSWLTGHAPWQSGGLSLGRLPWWADALLIYLGLCIVAHSWPSKGDFLNTKPHLLGLFIAILILVGILYLVLTSVALPWPGIARNAAQFEGNIAAAIVLMTLLEFALLLVVRRGR
jgi:hypothetical protein